MTETRIARSPAPTSRVRSLARELLLERADPVAEVEVEQRGRRRLEPLDPGARVAFVGRSARDVREAGQALVVGADRDHRVEPQHREVGQVVAVERLVADVGVDAAQAAQPAAAGAQAAPVGHLDRRARRPPSRG